MGFLAVLGIAIAAITVPQRALAQDRGAPQLDQLVRNLATTARVLVIGAHPDDEDTQTIAWLARGKGVETAYLSLTRGDGGQNLIGSELGESLGAIRTEELLAARRIDGGRQYFTRAFDFGFSKNAEETAKHWPRDTLLADVVTVIRAFRPHVIYSIWSGTRADGHGHHETSGLVARDAFDAASDTVRFPVRPYGEPWAPAKYYNRGAAIRIPADTYDPILGRTYADIAAESRSQHRSQGFAGVALRSAVPGAAGRGQPGGGPLGGSLIRTATRANAQVEPTAETSIFDGLDTTFTRLLPFAPPRVQDNLEGVSIKADSAFEALDFRQPWRVAPIIARMTSAIQQVRGQMFRCALRHRLSQVRRNDVSFPPRCNAGELDLDAALDALERRAGAALLAAAELRVEAIAPRELLAFGDSVRVTVTAVNHGRLPITIADLRVTGGPRSGFNEVLLRPDSGATFIQSVIGFPDTKPWWIGGREGGFFADARSPMDGLARVSATSEDFVRAVAVSEEMRRTTDVRMTLEIAGQSVIVNAGPLTFRTADPLLGVQDRPLGGVPPVTIEFDRNLEWIPAGKPIFRTIRLTLKSFADVPKSFSLVIVAPPGLKVDSMPARMTLPPRAQAEVFLRLSGTLKPGRYEFGVVGEDSLGAKFAEGFSTINYPHIRPIQRYRTSGLWLAAVEIEVPQRLQVAYIQGTGDDNAVYLRQLGVPVTMITPAELPAHDLSRFTTVVVGTRAAEANRALLTYAPRLMDFVRNGGTLVMQYHQNPTALPQLFPYPMEWNLPSADRVTDEQAPVTTLVPNARLLTWPNRIGPDDWKGWVQERALYLPNKLDPRYQSLLEMHDPGEPENRGSLVVAPLGKGQFVYTSLALFRQLPSAVNGSARLFVNLLSAGVPQASRPTP
jgi:LmbE family N-acetylglucosaminyl deacetylase